MIVSELADNPGTSVTNAIEQLAAEVMDALYSDAPALRRTLSARATGGRDETFDLVVFAHPEIREVLRGGIRRKALGPPTWTPLGRCEVEILVASPGARC